MLEACAAIMVVSWVGTFIVVVWLMMKDRSSLSRIPASAARRPMTVHLPLEIYDELSTRAALEDRSMHEQVIRILRLWYCGEQTQEKTAPPLPSGETVCAEKEM
jgi:hypothetical protein